MHLLDKYRGREKEPVTPDILREMAAELKGGHGWWAKIKGKCYAPAELLENIEKFKGLKIGDILQVDPHLELARANEILVKLHEKRIDFERRIKRYDQRFKP